MGIYSGGKSAENVKAGEKYIAKFKLRVPEEKEYETAGIHLRTGSDVLMEKDHLLLKEVNAPKTSQIRATKFESEASSLSEEDYDLTAGDAKWVNLEWVKPLAGVYEISAEVQVKDSASLGEKLFLNYRALGIMDDGAIDRFPEDDTVNLELYSNTKEEIFEVGIVRLCDESFCFTSTIEDIKGGFIDSVTDTYSAKVFNPYRLSFIITNNSDTRIHNAANLRVLNADETAKFFEYTFTDSETKQFQGIVNGFEFERLDG